MSLPAASPSRATMTPSSTTLPSTSFPLSHTPPPCRRTAASPCSASTTQPSLPMSLLPISHECGPGTFSIFFATSGAINEQPPEDDRDPTVAPTP
ncbi:hypothetical protein Taro_050755 [Colocasia esculenta]|uniref:Uncharacterized protein n=1 Tax=Colocasia esculenta TaxID=4460 RepID=A0A843XEW6_COLES|nr:hypothetical protein [Colocasia esculenta]